MIPKQAITLFIAVTFFSFIAPAQTSSEAYIQAEDFIEDAYILEVSSPGLGRPLKKEKDYVRSVGKSIDIKLYKAIDKQKEFTGILKENMEDQIVLTIEDQDITFEKKSIASARLSLDF